MRDMVNVNEDQDKRIAALTEHVAVLKAQARAGFRGGPDK